MGVFYTYTYTVVGYCATIVLRFFVNNVFASEILVSLSSGLQTFASSPTCVL